MELSINAVIIIIIAMIVLLAIGSLFTGVWSPQKRGIQVEMAKNNACRMLSLSNCETELDKIKIKDFDVDNDGVVGNDDDDTLKLLCSSYYGMDDENDCKTKICDCEE
ncbi:MAG: hypothetical protein V1818_03800 [Candidatus Aenigmatarchaeota archaeon]